MPSQYEHGPDFQTHNEAEISRLRDEIDRLRLDLCFCREAMRHADIDLSMVLPDVDPDMQKEFRKTLARLDEAKVRSLSNGPRETPQQEN